MSDLNLTACETCGETILVCDNDVWLDWPAVPYDEVLAPWTLFMAGPIALASAGNPGSGDAGHRLHLHQPL